MKKLILIAACSALAACGSNEAAETEEVVADDMAMESGVGDIAGTYEITTTDGTVIMQEINADGTYVDTVEGEETERGTWRENGEQMCFDPEGDEGERCYLGGEMGEDGSFEATDTEGNPTSTVRKIDAAG